jgi:hypothetical protein
MVLVFANGACRDIRTDSAIDNKQRDISPERRPCLRLNDFADPKPYTVAVDDADAFLRAAMCNSHGADRITQPSRRRQPLAWRSQLRT